MITTTEIQIPDSIRLAVLSKSLDLSDARHPQIKFRLQMSNDGKNAFDFDYSGGILAFTHEYLAKQEDQTEERYELRKQVWNGKIKIAKAKESGALKLAGWQNKYAVKQEGIQELFTLAHPGIKSVLYSLIMDANAGAETFGDFCANCGYDEDSRKALETYLKCHETGNQLRRCLGSLFSEVEKALEDY